jgi:hypothetical protein
MDIGIEFHNSMSCKSVVLSSQCVEYLNWLTHDELLYLKTCVQPDG